MSAFGGKADNRCRNDHPVFSPLTVTQTSDVRDHIIRVGLNYKFY